MKSHKYFAGGLIKGLGGQAIKQFMKSPMYKNTISRKMSELATKYSTKGATTPSQKKFIKQTKSLLEKEAKAGALMDSMKSRVKALTLSTKALRKNPKAIGIEGGDIKDLRNMSAAGLKAMRNLKKYRKNVRQKIVDMVTKKVTKPKVN
jgi:uncharacterized coiled-coil DUF342 family protein|tara:strand:- start:47 stop:493 length:447 start_codon:yes stop_codon:yes gene_type:complete